MNQSRGQGQDGVCGVLPSTRVYIVARWVYPWRQAGESSLGRALHGLSQ